MVYQNSASYLWIKGQTYYFNRRVLRDIQSYYSSSRIVICLKTGRRDSALRSAKSIAQRLEDYWTSLRLVNIDIPAFHLLRREPQKLSKSGYDSLSQALDLYLRLKGVNKDKTFRRGAERNIQSVIDVLGDRPLDENSSSDAAAYRDYLLKLGLTTNSVKSLKERKLVGVDISNVLTTSKKDAWLKASNDNQPKPGVFAKNSRLKDANWITSTTRGANDFIHCSHLVYLNDQNINPVVAGWLGDSSRAFNDAYALTELIQWVWRSRVRRAEPITLYLPSPRMRRLFEEWLVS